MKELELFFEKQINEHQLVVERSKNMLMDSFLNTVKICIESLKENKKLLFFLVTEGVLQMHNIFQLNSV